MSRGADGALSAFPGREVKLGDGREKEGEE